MPPRRPKRGIFNQTPDLPGTGQGAHEAELIPVPVRVRRAAEEQRAAMPMPGSLSPPVEDPGLHVMRKGGAISTPVDNVSGLFIPKKTQSIKEIKFPAVTSFRAGAQIILKTKKFFASQPSADSRQDYKRFLAQFRLHINAQNLSIGDRRTLERAILKEQIKLEPQIEIDNRIKSAEFLFNSGSRYRNHSDMAKAIGNLLDCLDDATAAKYSHIARVAKESLSSLFRNTYLPLATKQLDGFRNRPAELSAEYLTDLLTQINVAMKAANAIGDNKTAVDLKSRSKFLYTIRI